METQNSANGSINLANFLNADIERIVLIPNDLVNRKILFQTFKDYYTLLKGGEDRLSIKDKEFFKQLEERIDQESKYNSFGNIQHPNSSDSDTNDEIENLRIKNAVLTSQLEKEKQQNEDLKQQNEDLKQQNEDLKQQNEDLMQQNEDLMQQNEDLMQQNEKKDTDFETFTAAQTIILFDSILPIRWEDISQREVARFLAKVQHRSPGSFKTSIRRIVQTSIGIKTTSKRTKHDIETVASSLDIIAPEIARKIRNNYEKK